jgi:hypothetical protein
MRTLFTISVAFVALIIVDAIGFDSTLRDSGLRDVRFQIQALSDEWKRSMRPAAQFGGSYSPQRMLFRPVRPWFCRSNKMLCRLSGPK